MTKWPLLLSVPHAGKTCPQALRPFNMLSQTDIIDDGDEQAESIYFPLQNHVQKFLTTTIARAYIDLNRRPDDFSDDGVFKSKTIRNKTIYSQSPPKPILTTLLDHYYYPYHKRLSQSSSLPVRLAIDCHTMTDIAPPIAKDAGNRRPDLCISYNEMYCPAAWPKELMRLFSLYFKSIRINDPFSGGFIMKNHQLECPWIQLEINRSNRYATSTKQQIVEQVLSDFIKSII